MRRLLILAVLMSAAFAANLVDDSNPAAAQETSPEQPTTMIGEAPQPPSSEATPVVAAAPEVADPFGTGMPLYGTRNNPWTAIMQTWLRENGFRPGPSDAWFGLQTENAVKRFQQAAIDQGLYSGPVDGVWWWDVSQAQKAYVAPAAPAPAPEPEQVSAPTLSGRCSQWSDNALRAGFTASQWPTVDRLMWRESNCQPGAYNRSGASGLMQIMPMWADDCGGSRSDLFDPDFNLRCAVHIYHVSGWGAWSTY